MVDLYRLDPIDEIARSSNPAKIDDEMGEDGSLWAHTVEASTWNTTLHL